MTPRLKALAAEIERRFPDLVTALDSWTSDTDRHPKGVRWRIPGKGRKGTRLRVFERRGPGLGPADYFNPILEHRAGDTYRKNQDVVDWIEREAAWRERSEALGPITPEPSRVFVNGRWVCGGPERRGR